MSSGFQNPITIKDAIDKIHSRQFLLPAIQRKFTWSSNQIEMFFDSILCGYPINSFMLWKISMQRLRVDINFMSSLLHIESSLLKTIRISIQRVFPISRRSIDGQQRLTSLYIGLRGSYAYKMPRKWWKNTEDCLTTRKLYLNLGASVKQQYDNQKAFDFRFLSKGDLDKFNKSQDGSIWFEVAQILDLWIVERR